MKIVNINLNNWKDIKNKWPIINFYFILGNFCEALIYTWNASRRRGIVGYSWPTLATVQPAAAPPWNFHVSRFHVDTPHQGLLNRIVGESVCSVFLFDNHVFYLHRRWTMYKRVLFWGAIIFRSAAIFNCFLTRRRPRLRGKNASHLVLVVCAF